MDELFHPFHRLSRRGRSHSQNSPNHPKGYAETMLGRDALLSQVPELNTIQLFKDVSSHLIRSGWMGKRERECDTKNEKGLN